MVRAPGHPRAATANGYVFEHILVAEAILGRPLVWYGVDDPRSEIVHHINGDKSDNRRENLEITSLSAHARLHNQLREASDISESSSTARTLLPWPRSAWSPPSRVGRESSCGGGVAVVVDDGLGTT